MNPVHPADVHRAPPTRVEDRDTTDRWTGPARPWPRPRRRVRRACDRRSRARRPLPRDAIHDDRRVGGSPPGRTMRDAAHPPHPGRGGGDAPASRPARKIRRRHDPSRPVPEADRQPDPPPPRSRGPRRARGLDAASGRPRADPAAAAGPFGLVEEPDNDDGRRVLPPPGRRGPGTAPPGAAAGPGCLHPPAHGPDGAVASSAADAAVSHAHPDPRAKKTTAPSRTRPPRGPPELRPQPSDPGAPLRGHGISAETGAPPAILRPGTRPPAPQDCTIRPPQPPARTPGRSRERPAP